MNSRGLAVFIDIISNDSRPNCPTWGIHDGFLEKVVKENRIDGSGSMRDNSCSVVSSSITMSTSPGGSGPVSNRPSRHC